MSQSTEVPVAYSIPATNETGTLIQAARVMRSLTHTVTNSLTTPVAAGADETRRALQRLDLIAPVMRALHAMGVGDRVAVGSSGLSWRLQHSDGHVEVDVDVRVEPASHDSCFLSITTGFRATDGRPERT